jgi:hypothetical protein
LQQVIYNTESVVGKFTLFESSNKYKTASKAVEKSKNEEESESSEKSVKSSVKSDKSENDDNEEEKEETSENIEDVEESVSLLKASITKSKLEKIIEVTDEENSKSKEKEK